MGQYQGKSTKGIDEELAGDQKPDAAVEDHSTSDPKAIAGVTNADVQPQPPVFGSPLDSKWSEICYLQFVFTISMSPVKYMGKDLWTPL